MVVNNGEKGRNSYNVSAEDFTDVWQQSSTVDEAAARLKMPKAIAQARACKYRNAGVRLKKMSRVPQGKIDVAALNKRIEEIEGQAAAPEM